MLKLMPDRRQRDLTPVAGMDREIAILMAADEAYAPPLAVCVASLLEHLAADCTVDLYLIGPGLTASTQSRLEAWWRDRVRVRALAAPPERLAELRELVGGESLPAHLRALLGSTLPREVSKVIYLDADILVRRDVRELWQQDMQGNILLAAQDSYVHQLPGHCVPPRLAKHEDRPYFNSGVMVIDVDAWRLAGIEEAYLEAVRRVGTHSRWADQDALNACLVDRWGVLPPVWNRQFALCLYPDWRCTPHREEEFLRARSEPAIVHFCSRTKPWHRFCDHSDEDVRRFRSWLRRVPLEVGPADPPTLLERTIERLSAPHRRLLDTIAAALKSRQRRHAVAVMLPGILGQVAAHPWTLVSVPVSGLTSWVSRWAARR